MNLKTLYLTKKYSGIKWEEFKAGKHKMETYKINKISLSCFDDKRFVLHHRIYMLAYFHKDLRNRFTQMIINKNRFKKILTNGYK